MLIDESPDRKVDLPPISTRPWWTRASGAQVLMVTAGIIAFIANLAVLRSTDDTVLVAVAAADITAGTRVDPDRHIAYLSVGVEGVGLAPLVTGGEVASLAAGKILTSSMREGDVFVESDLVPAATGDGLKVMSIPLRLENAVGGDIVAGDTIDVIAVTAGVARYVVNDIEVIQVPGERRGAFSTSGAFFVTVAVDDSQVLELSAAAASSDVRIAKSTGAVSPGSTTFGEEVPGR